MVVERKPDIRRRMGMLRSDLSAEQHRTRSAEIWSNLLGSDLLTDCDRVASYAAIGSEVATGGLFSLLSERGVDVFYPRCDQNGRLLSFVRVRSLSELSPGLHGIPEPAGPPAPLQDLDLVVVPGLAFDRQGRRLGYGAGYYDRSLAACRALSVGIAFDFQLLQRLPEDPHDLRVDAVVTEKGVLRARGSTASEPAEGA